MFGNAPLNAIADWITRPEDGFVAPAHRGAVTCIAVDDDGLILSAGSDGFLVIWDSAGMAARERFQLSRYAIERIAVRPGKRELAVYESDGIGFYRVSVWDYAEKEPLFSLQVTSPVLYCGYTARGSYLILGFSNGLLLFDGKTGEQHGERLGSNPVTVAVSNRTERTLQTYSSSGVLAYWDLSKSALVRSFSVPSNLATPFVFGNYRFLAGQDGGRLFLIDAVSGKTFFETEAVTGGVLVCANDTGASFFRVSFLYDETGGGGVLKREVFTVAANGAVDRGETFASMDAILSTVAPLDESLLLSGSDDGRLAIFAEGMDEAVFFSFRNQRRLLDAAASADGVIAFVDENGYGAFIPASFASLNGIGSIALFSAAPSNRVTGGDDGSFLFWRYGEEAAYTGAGADQIFPFVKRYDAAPGETEPADRYTINDSGPPLRSAAMSGNEVLFLDVSGGIRIFSLEDGRRLFSYTSALSLDAIFSGDRGILVARNTEAGRGAAPFLFIDTVSGETLPAAYPAFAAFTLYKNSVGNIYAAVLKAAGRDIKTEVIRFDRQNPETSNTIFEYNGEDTDFSFIEYAATDDEPAERFASTAGGEGAFIILDGVKIAAERGPAFPQKLLSQNGNFAALDGDGAVSWYDGVSGRLIAMLRFYETEWLLSTAGGTTRRGSLTNQLTVDRPRPARNSSCAVCLTFASKRRPTT